MNGKSRDMDYKFAIKVLNSAKVDTPSIHGNPKCYGYQNQTFYDIARRMAVQALKEKYEKEQPADDVVEVVRCKDCKNAYINSFSAQSGIALCKLLTNRANGEQVLMRQDDFCCYGVRKDRER